MSGDGINQVGGVSIQSTPTPSPDQGVDKAGKPQRLNRSSIEALPEAERKLPSSSEKTVEFKPLSSRKISHITGKLKLLLTRPKKEASLQDLGGVQQQNKVLSKMVEQQSSKKAQNKPQADRQVKDLEEGLKWAKTNHKKAVKLASSASLKMSVADKTGVPPQLTTVEKTALQELGHAQQLVGQFEGKLAEAKTEFRTVEKLKDGFATRLEKLEKKVSEASGAVNTKFTPLSVSDHKSRVSDLEKKLAAVESALKDLNQLGEEVEGAEKAHPGATPKKFDEKVQKLLSKAEGVREKGPEVLQKAKSKRDQVVKEQVETKRAARQAARDEREMNKAYKDTRRLDRQQDQQAQRRQVELGKKPRRSSQSSVTRQEPQTKKSRVKRSSSLNDLDKLQPVKKQSQRRSSSASSSLSGKVSWSPEDQALENRLKKLKGQVTHETITPSGRARNFGQLEKQLHSISSVDDLKVIVADRRSSKITPDQQRKYLGLLNAAVQGMAKNSQYAQQMNADLIRDVLKEQPSEAKAAVKILDQTLADNLQRRLDRLKGK